MSTFRVPFHATVHTVIEEAYQKGLDSCPTSRDSCVIEEQGEWEIDHDNIEEMAE